MRTCRSDSTYIILQECAKDCRKSEVVPVVFFLRTTRWKSAVLLHNILVWHYVREVEVFWCVVVSHSDLRTWVWAAKT